MTSDPNHIAFRELLRQAERDPALAAELSRLMAELAPLPVLLSLASAAALPASVPKSRTPGSEAGDR